MTGTSYVCSARTAQNSAGCRPRTIQCFKRNDRDNRIGAPITVTRTCADVTEPDGVCTIEACISPTPYEVCNSRCVGGLVKEEKGCCVFYILSVRRGSFCLP